ncbi:unnamed protein product [Merluccius merluccius]
MPGSIFRPAVQQPWHKGVESVKQTCKRATLALRIRLNAEPRAKIGIELLSGKRSLKMEREGPLLRGLQNRRCLRFLLHN